MQNTNWMHLIFNDLIIFFEIWVSFSYPKGDFLVFSPEAKLKHVVRELETSAILLISILLLLSDTTLTQIEKSKLYYWPFVLEIHRIASNWWAAHKFYEMCNVYWLDEIIQ